MTSYRKMSVAEKTRYAREQLRERALRCPRCEMAMQPDELLQHLRERCPGRQDPHPLSAWVTWGQAEAIGVLPGTLHRWVRKGRVRRKAVSPERSRRGGRPRRHLYLLRDIVACLADTIQMTSNQQSKVEACQK